MQFREAGLIASKAKNPNLLEIFSIGAVPKAESYEVKKKFEKNTLILAFAQCYFW